MNDSKNIDPFQLEVKLVEVFLHFQAVKVQK